MAGTIAMFLVGGGILVHGIPALAHFIEAHAHVVGELPVIGEVLAALTPLLANVLAGVLTGALALAAVTGFQRLRGAGGN